MDIIGFEHDSLDIHIICTETLFLLKLNKIIRSSKFFIQHAHQWFNFWQTSYWQ